MAAERPDKKEKKDKKRSDEAGVSKPKKEKKDKKEKKEKLAAAIEDKLQQDAAAQSGKPAKNDEDSDMEDNVEEVPLERTVVPFAIPVADEKGMKKVYKTIRKGAPYSAVDDGVGTASSLIRQRTDMLQRPRTAP